MNADNEHITAREFDQRMGALMNAMTDGFSGVNERIGEVKGELREMNSKVATQGRDITELRATSLANKVTVDGHQRKLDKIDTTVGYRHARKDDKPDDDSKPVTRRDINVAVGVGIICVGGIVWLFMTFGSFVQRSAS